MTKPIPVGNLNWLRALFTLRLSPVRSQTVCQRMKVHASLEIKTPTLHKFKSVLPPGKQVLYYLQADFIMVKRVF